MKMHSLILGSIAALGLAAAFSATAYASPPDPMSALGVSSHYSISDTFGDILGFPTLGLQDLSSGDPAGDHHAISIAPVADAGHALTLHRIDLFDSDALVVHQVGSDMLVGDAGYGFASGGGHLFDSASPGHLRKGELDDTLCKAVAKALGVPASVGCAPS